MHTLDTCKWSNAANYTCFFLHQGSRNQLSPTSWDNPKIWSDNYKVLLSPVGNHFLCVNNPFVLNVDLILFMILVSNFELESQKQTKGAFCVNLNCIVTDCDKTWQSCYHYREIISAQTSLLWVKWFLRSSQVMK